MYIYIYTPYNIIYTLWTGSLWEDLQESHAFLVFFFVTTAPSAAVDLPTGMPQGDGRSIISSSVAISKGNFSEFLWLDDFTSVHLATETLKSNRINKN